MKKRAGAKLNSNSKNGVSPLPLSCPNRNTPPKPYEFKVTRFTSSKKKTAPAHAPSPFLQPQNPSPSNKNPATVSDLKDLAASRANSIKRCLDLCHSEILKEIEASNSRLSKRFKVIEIFNRISFSFEDFLLTVLGFDLLGSDVFSRFSVEVLVVSALTATISCFFLLLG